MNVTDCALSNLSIRINIRTKVLSLKPFFLSSSIEPFPLAFPIAHNSSMYIYFARTLGWGTHRIKEMLDEKLAVCLFTLHSYLRNTNKPKRKEGKKSTATKTCFTILRSHSSRTFNINFINNIYVFCFCSLSFFLSFFSR